MVKNSNTKQNRISIYPILSVNFVGTLGFSIVLPFLVFLVTKWGGNALIYGIMGATYSFFQLIGAPILGRWSDKIGRRKVLLLSQAGTFLSWVILLVAFFLPVKNLLSVNSSLLGEFTLTLPLLVLFLARAADGLTGVNVSVATAYLADISSDENRHANYGKMSISSNLGFVLGPAMAGILGATAMGEILPVTAALIISALATVLIIVKLPESNRCAVSKHPEANDVSKVFGQELKPCFEAESAKKVSVGEILKLKNMKHILAIYFLIMLAFNFFYIAFPVYAVKTLEWNVTQTGIFFTVLSLLMVIVQGPVLSRLSKKCSDTFLMATGSIILVFGFFFFATTNITLIYIAAALMALGNGLMWPSTMAALSKAAGDKYQGAVQGYAGSGGAIASIIGLVVGGVMYGFLEDKIFIMSAIIIFLTALMSISLLLRKGPPPRAIGSLN